ncbi:hypothetical protein MVEN_02533400 [Mycena venus]|uniref:Transcription regulator Rua1 C-terminal domain-containing protein n=1 Tax=Mycena venus TaxID=2733690 RepID=A0A8H6WUU5_9AGAR|nr:hypothetical protein MVEN_02533400 [Mycena venus]
MYTPADLLILPHAFKGAITPFGKRFELSDDWIPSGSYVSPVMRAQNMKQPPLKLFPSPAMTFMDRLKASSSPPSGAVVPHRFMKNGACSPPALALPVVQSHTQFPIDLFSSSPLTSSSSSPISRRPLLRFKARGRISPPRPTNTLFPVSPLTPLTPSPNKLTSVGAKKPISPALDAKPRKRRLSLSMPDSPTCAKRTRYNQREENSAARAPPVLALTKSAQSGPIFSTRTFPSAPFVVSPHFPLFYRRFPASSYFQTMQSGSPYTLFGVSHPGGEYKAPRNVFDLYSARFVKGRGTEKMGLCPICIEPLRRGGEGKKVWLSMKFSAFKCYHMQFHHGISASSGRPLSPPIDFRVVPRSAPKKGERVEVNQGKCRKCLCWVVIETVKDIEVKVPELFWWKHAVACHTGSVLAGEGDVFEEDEVYRVLKGL